ncbi:MAG: N-acetyl-alpha-D-glucosaminyl L-malate synthase [Calditrichaeota bacterium]|nr:N-acetyl-alpha-D-glucosaminyl L-malate synthase [Calditrichota bacterium]
MRISFVNFAADWGGGEGWTLRTAEGLAERGHAIYLIARVDAPLAERARAHALPGDAFRVSFDYHPGMIIRIRDRLALFNADAVVVHHNKDVRTGAVAAKLLRLPVVHRNGYPIVRDTLRHRLTMRFVDRILTNSQRIHDSYARLQWMRTVPIDLVPNGIDTGDTYDRNPNLRREMGARDGDLLALYAGRLTGVKQVDLLLRAFAGLGDGHRWRLAIAGGGNRRDPLRRLATRLGLAGTVRFLGFRSDSRALAASADLAVLPSREEGMPNALMEAMAAGVPVAATPVGDVPLLLDHGRAGWLLPVDDPGPWTDLLARLAGSPDQLTTMGETGRQRVRDRFSFGAMIEGVQRVLHAAVGD